MFNSKRVRGVWWVCAVLAVLLVAGCVSAASEESGGSAPLVDGSGGAGAGSVPSSSSVVAPPLPLPVGVSNTGVEETVVQVGEENGGGEASSGVESLEPVGGVVSAEVSVSEEGLERLRRVLGEDKYAVVLEAAERLGEPGQLGVDGGVLLGRLAGESGFLTEGGLGRLAERRSGEYLVWAADIYSEEELAEYANESEEQMAEPWAIHVWAIDVWDVDGRFADEYSDEDVKGLAFYKRAEAELDNRLWEDNSLSTPVGAFCWAVLRVRHIEDWTDTGIGSGFRPWRSRNLYVWHLEREAEERGIELEWETPPVDARVLRRVLLEVTAPEVRSVVFDPGLPSVLRPAAEALYSVYDELLALPVRRIRPTVEELSAYRRLRGLTDEEIAQIWPDELELDYREDDKAEYDKAMDVLRDDEVRGVLNAECKERPEESACPPWEAPETAVLLNTECNDFKDLLEDIGPLYSCPLFFKDRNNAEADLIVDLESGECTINEEAAERFNEVMEALDELMEREETDK